MTGLVNALMSFAEPNFKPVSQKQSSAAFEHLWIFLIEGFSDFIASIQSIFQAKVPTSTPPQNSTMKGRAVEVISGGEEDDEFLIIDSSKSDEEVNPVLERLRGRGDLGSAAIMDYASYLKDEKQDTPFIFINNFLTPDQIKDKESVIKSISDAIAQSNGHLVFIPFILEGSIKDHVVLICIKDNGRTLEYYNSQGGKLEDETRNVLGVGISPKDIFQELLNKSSVVKFNSKRQQEKLDFVNCGVFVSRFMRERLTRDFKSISSDKVNIAQERKRMATELES